MLVTALGEDRYGYILAFCLARYAGLRIHECFRIDPATGKQVQKSIYGKTRKEIREKLAQITVDLDDGTCLEPAKSTVGQWLTLGRKPVSPIR